MIASVGLALIGNLATNTVLVSWRWWPLTVWLLEAAFCLVAVLIERSRAVADAEGRNLELAAAALAGEVADQWTHEAAVRQVFQPVPL